MTRRDQILKLIVEHFIKTAEPVGSKTLQETYHLDVSSATIRNEMNALEQDGYLEKTHTSSGRVPSEKGYHYYATNLKGGSVDEEAKNALATLLSEKTKSVEEVMKESCEILSQMTDLASCVLGNNVDEEKLVSIQIIPIGENTATAVFVTDKGYVENKTFMIDKSLHLEDVVKTIKLLNDRLTGTPISQLVNKMESIKPLLTDYMVGQEVIYEAIKGAFARFATERMEMYGKDKLFEQPEFANDAGKIKELLGFLEDPEKFRKTLEHSDLTSSGIRISIGGDDGDISQALALLSADVSVPGDNSATLTLVGPSRMDYEKAVATLRYFAEALDEYFNSQEEDEEEEGWEEKNPNNKKAKA